MCQINCIIYVNRLLNINILLSKLRVRVWFIVNGLKLFKCLAIYVVIAIDNRLYYQVLDSESLTWQSSCI